MKTTPLLAAAALLTAAAARPAAAINFSDSGRWTYSAGTGSVSANRGDPIQLTWSLPPDGTVFNDYIPGDINTLHADYARLAGPNYLDMFSFMFGRLGAVSGLQFSQSPDDGAISETAGAPGVRGDIRVMASNMTAYYAPYFSYTGGGWAGMPGQGGNIHINTYQPWTYVDLLKVTMHESGHAVGFGHQQIYANSVTTSEFSTPDPETSGLMVWGNYGSITGFVNRYGPQFDDLYAMNRMYGDIFERNGGNDTPAKATGLGNLSTLGAKAVGTQINGLTVGPTDTDFVSIDGTSDTDCYAFHLDRMSAVTVAVTPKGPTYDYTPEGGTRQTMVASSQSDLWFDLLDSLGQTLAHVNGTGLGEAENLLSQLGPGDYVLSIAGTQDLNQFYRLDVSAVAVPEPATLGVVALGVMGLAGRRGLRRGRPC